MNAMPALWVRLEILSIWRNTRMMVLCAVTAASYGALLLAFKPVFVLIPGVTEIRPANGIPVVCSFLFGPAAAWGSAFGNLIADFGGTLGIGSIGGFIGNFLYGYLPYKLWQLFSRNLPDAKSPVSIVAYLLVTAIASMACAFMITWWIALVRLVPPVIAFRVIGTVIFFNNWVFCIILAPILLASLGERTRRWGLHWKDIIGNSSQSLHPVAWIGSLVLLIAIPLGAAVAIGLVGATYEFSLGSWHFGFQVPALKQLSAFPPLYATAPFTAAIFAGCVMSFLGRTDSRQQVPVPQVRSLPDEKAIAQVRDLNFAYPDAVNPAIRGINLCLETGSFVVFTGPAGAGKSTLCRCLNGLIPHFQKGNLTGEVIIRGQDVSQTTPAELSSQVGMVFQDFEAQLFSTSAELEVAFGPENQALSRTEIKNRIVKSMETVGLRGFGTRSPASLSGGEKQRLAIASVLAMEPQLLIMDEPTTDLDPQGKRDLFRVAQRLREGAGGANGVQCVVMVEHELEEAATFADRVIVMVDGKLQMDGQPVDVLTRVEELEAIGVHPPQIPSVFAALGESERPLTEQEALAAFHAKGRRFSQTGINRLRDLDVRRSDQYGETIIEVRKLCHVYPGGQTGVKNVSCDIRKGEFIALIGQNGCGKTTFARHLNGLLYPTEGEVLVFGNATRTMRLTELAKRVGYVFQNPDHQLFADTVRADVSFGPQNMGFDQSDVDDRVREALQAVHLDGYEDADPFSLTKGERQRVAVAGVLAARPEVLILDEPTTGLDYRQIRAMMDLIQQLNRQGHTVVITTHAMWVVAEYAQRTIVMQDGTVIADGPTRDVFSQVELLEKARLRVPDVTRFGIALGFPALSIDEFVTCSIAT